jgi:hypothetical protein
MPAAPAPTTMRSKSNQERERAYGRGLDRHPLDYELLNEARI